MPKKKKIEKQPMVGWYDPGQVLRTGYDVTLSATLGKHAETRIIQAISETSNGKPRLFHEITGLDDQEFWFATLRTLETDSTQRARFAPAIR